MLPLARFSDFEDPGGARSRSRGDGPRQACGRVARLAALRQIKGAPVNAKQRARIEIEKGLDRFLRGEMH